MTTRGQYPRGHHPYGPAYRRARRAILGPAGGGDLERDPSCHWCDNVAVTADHEPPLELAGPHLNLVPACRPCNYGRHGKTPAPKRAYPPASRAW